VIKTKYLFFPRNPITKGISASIRLLKRWGFIDNILTVEILEAKPIVSQDLAYTFWNCELTVLDCGQQKKIMLFGDPRSSQEECTCQILADFLNAEKKLHIIKTKKKDVTLISYVVHFFRIANIMVAFYLVISSAALALLFYLSCRYFISS